MLLRAAALRHRRVGQGKCQCVAGYKGEGCEEEPPDLGGPLLVLMAMSTAFCCACSAYVYYLRRYPVAAAILPCCMPPCAAVGRALTACALRVLVLGRKMRFSERERKRKARKKLRAGKSKKKGGKDKKRDRSKKKGKING